MGGAARGAGRGAGEGPEREGRGTGEGPEGPQALESRASLTVGLTPMTEHDDALSLDMVTAALRADSTDVAIYARVLAQSLGEALPPDLVSVERDRTMSDRMRGRPGEISK